MHEEKRRFMRFNVLWGAFCRRGDTSRKLKVSNFSKEGVGVIGKEALKKGEEIEIEFTIPGDNIPVVLQGEVAWSSDPISDNSQYKSGIKFSKVRNEDRGRILEYIYNRWLTPVKPDKVDLE
jgi:hypothetical protein